MRNVLLFNPPLYFARGVPHSLDTTSPPLGLLYLASHVHSRSRDFRVHIVDFAPGRPDLAEARSKVASLAPIAVGISCMTPQLQGAVELARYLRTEAPGPYKVFLGGAHVSGDPGFLERHAGLFDHAICGEGECTFLDSLQRLLAGHEVEPLQHGIPLQDLDSLPLPDRTLVNPDHYLREDHERAAFIITSRGCPYQCYFCSSPAIDNRRVRYRSVTSVMAEIRDCAPHSGGRITFCDDTFTLKRDFVLALCRELRDFAIPLRWRCNARIDLVDDALLRAMREAGCEAISFGVETANQHLRQEEIRKGSFSNARIWHVVRLCKRYGIRTNGNFILGNPGETWKDIRATRRMILESGFDGLSLTMPTPFPGSRLFELAQEKGIISEAVMDRFARKELGEGYAGVYPLFIAEGLSREALLAEMALIHRRFYITLRNFLGVLKRDCLSFRQLMMDAHDLWHLVTHGGTRRKPYTAYRDNPVESRGGPNTPGRRRNSTFR